MAVYTEVLNGQKFSCKVDESEHRVIEYAGKVYDSLSTLFEHAPELKEESNVLGIAKIVNYMLGGENYLLIENPEYFAERYQARSQLAPDFGVYDVSSVKSPYIENGTLIFYVENVGLGVPYRVSLSFPYDSKQPCFYSLLPRI